ncbi:MAG: site-2 protease family protein, partial [Minisyncoccia bacterium]
MSIIIFIIILSALVIVHELGHFLVARFFGIRVDEFGLGFPPRAKELFTWKGTPFTLNWLPFGGFVKIFGESPTEETNSTDS